MPLVPVCLCPLLGTIEILLGANSRQAGTGCHVGSRLWHQILWRKRPLKSRLRTHRCLPSTRAMRSCWGGRWTPMSSWSQCAGRSSPASGDLNRFCCQASYVLVNEAAPGGPPAVGSCFPAALSITAAACGMLCTHCRERGWQQQPQSCLLCVRREVKAAAKAAGAYGCTISGAGPTCVAVVADQARSWAGPWCFWACC